MYVYRLFYFLACDNCGGLELCARLEECCTYYDGDVCTNDCGNNKFAGEETGFNCVCTNNNLALPDCTGMHTYSANILLIYLLN